MRPQAGSTRADNPDGNPEPTDEDTMSARTPRILIVDDEADLRTVLRFGLEAEGFDVIEAGDGEEGLRRAHELLPDLMVLDLMLPKMDGYKVCRTLKFDERFRGMPVVILSARSGEQDRQLAHTMGADAFVTKPYEMRGLVAVIRQKLEEPRRSAA
jgi:DNA-binding response OmpR family regulator